MTSISNDKAELSRQERIAELEREIEACEAATLTPTGEEYLKACRSELSRLRNESGSGEAAQAEPFAWVYRDPSSQREDLAWRKPVPPYVDIRPLYTAAPQPDALRKALEGLSPVMMRELEARRFVQPESGRYLLTQSQAFDAFVSTIAALSTPAPAQSDERAGMERAAEWNAKAIIALEAIAKLQGAAIELGPAIASGFFEARSLSQGDRSNG